MKADSQPDAQLIPAWYLLLYWFWLFCVWFWKEKILCGCFRNDKYI